LGENEKKRLRRLVGALAGTAGGACILLFFFPDLLRQTVFHTGASLSDLRSVREAILANGSLAPTIFLALQILQVVVAPLPGEVSGILGGYLFGAGSGFFLSSIGLTIGSWIAFGTGRLFGDLVTARLARSASYHRFNRLIRKGDFAIPFLCFLIPGFPKDLLSYMLGMSSMPIKIFMFITGFARMPGTLMLSFQGAQVYEGNYTQLAILLGVSFAVTVPSYLFRKRIMAWLYQQADGNRGKKECKLPSSK